MKKILLILLVVILLGGVYFVANSFRHGDTDIQDSSKQDTKFLTFESKSTGFSIEYPDILKEELDGDYIFSRKSVADSSSPQFYFIVNSNYVSFQKATSDLEKFASTSKTDLIKENMTVTGLPAVKYVFTAYADKEGKIPLKIMKVIIKKGEDKIYFIDYSNIADQFDIDLPMALKMLNSFKTI